MQTEKWHVGGRNVCVCVCMTAYYTWIQRGDVLVVSQYVANTEARFTYTDVRVIREVQMASVEKYAYALQAAARSVNFWRQ